MGTLEGKSLVKQKFIDTTIFVLFVYFHFIAITNASLEKINSYEGKVVKYSWEVEYQFWSPDCVEKVVIGINGEFPGPTIRGRVGDVLEVQVCNLLPTESISIHWHGINQVETPWADGAAFVTQCTINPGETFTYVFKLDKAGTYTYYGLNGLQRTTGLYGMLIVDANEPEPFTYDGEFSLLLSDWWHKSTDEISTGLSKPLPQFKWIGEPQSLLVNGRGMYKCELVPKGNSPGSGDVRVCNNTNPQCSKPVVLPVLRAKTYRIRIASATSLSSLNFLIERHKLIVVEVDGNYVDPVELDDLDVYSGQSYSVLLNTNQFPGRNYWMTINVRGRAPKTPPHLGILNYAPVPSSSLPFTPPPNGPKWDDVSHSVAQSNLYRSREGFGEDVPVERHHQLILLNTQNMVEGRIRWSINNVSLSLPKTPYLPSMVYDIEGSFDPQQPHTIYDLNYDINLPPKNINSVIASMVYRIPLGSTVDIILQNANTLFPKNSEIHPWHLHGHHFWVIGQGIGKFDPDKDPKSFNLENPPMRHTVTLFPYGWVAIRYKANNMGVWLFRCNIEPHFFIGMGVVLEQGVEWLEEVPTCTMGCGRTKELFSSIFIRQQ